MRDEGKSHTAHSFTLSPCRLYKSLRSTDCVTASFTVQSTHVDEMGSDALQCAPEPAIAIYSYMCKTENDRLLKVGRQK